MKLDELVKEAITQIAHGIHMAKIEVKDLVAVSPGILDGKTLNEKSLIEFDVAITVVEKEESLDDGQKKISAGISVVGVKIGGDIGKDQRKSNSLSNETVSRIAFQVPIYYNSHYRKDPDFPKEEEFIKGVLEGRKS